MRVGIYLGRHAGKGGGIAVYASSLVLAALRLLAQHGYEDDEVVFYGEKGIFTDALLDEVSLSPVLSAVVSTLLDTGAGRYFRTLPNGARCRLLVRVLPDGIDWRSGMLLDQGIVPFLALLDGLDALHSTTNYGILLCRKPQIITVHDLYQAWPVALAEQDEHGRLTRVLPPVTLAQRLYRLLFGAQFHLADQVIVDAQATADDIYHKYMFDPARIALVPLGLDEPFVRFAELQRKDWPRAQQLVDDWAEELHLPSRPVLVLASADPRKNFSAALRAWLALPSELQQQGLIVHIVDNRARRLAESMLGDKSKDESVVFLEWLPREQLPLLFARAEVLLFPTLAEGFGLPVMEALALGTKVVSGEVEAIKSSVGEGLIACDPYDEDSVRLALLDALGGNERKKGGFAVSKVSRRRAGKHRAPASAEIRSMDRVVFETFLVYREVALRNRGW